MAYRPRPEQICLLGRHAKLTRNRAYLKSKQYAGKPDWFTGEQNGKVVPLRERAPCIIYPLPKAAVNQIVRFTFGESRFPTINIAAETPDQGGTETPSLSENEAKDIEVLVKNLVETCKLKPAMRRTMRPGLAVGTVVALLTLKRGVFSLQVANAEDCFPQFEGDDPAGDVVSLTWCYQTEQTVDGPDGKPQSKLFWYRQDIDAEKFVEYALIPVEVGKDPVWGTGKETAHRFGMCPVVWIRNLAEEESTDIDGVSVYGELHKEFDALNFSLSQRHRGIVYFGTPQAFETGVEDDDGPQAGGRTATSGYSRQGAGSPHGESSRPARKVAPDKVWSYRSKDVKVDLMETTGKAFEVSSLHINDIRSRVLESMSVVLVNLSDIMGRTQQGQMSAKFLELAYEPLLALVDEMRHLWWFDGLQRILSMMLRIIAELGGDLMLIPGAKKCAPILKRFFVEVADVTGARKRMWMPPTMAPAWGDYFSAGPEEIAQAILAATQAKDAHLVPDEDAIKYVLPYFGREDTHEALQEIEADKQEAADRMLEQTTAEASALHAMTNAGGGAQAKREG